MIRKIGSPRSLLGENWIQASNKPARIAR
uniref:Uncharacterized protein n=1 Tax=Rhizophora mucronata TaxID=61149 RepID=A0A2P2PP43_RHIMU